MRNLTLCALVAAVASPIKADNGVRADDRGLSFEAGQAQVTLGGRVHLDGAVFDEPSSGDTGETEVDFRRARLELSGRFGDVLRFEVDREFAGKSKGWRNVWLQFEPIENVRVRGGNFIVPFSAEDLQSSNTLPFAERSLGSSLAPGFGLGGSVSAYGDRWSATAGYFTDPLDNEEGHSSERGRGVAGRVTFLPLTSDALTLHVGLAGEHRTFKATEEMRFSADPGSMLAPTLMSSGTIGNIDNLTGWNGDAAISFGPVLVQAQATGLALKRQASADLSFSGQTVQASWLITGGRYDYSESQGLFNGPHLRRGKGAVEIAARYSRLDMTDDAVIGGNGRAITAGANWYLNRNLRLMADYTDSHVDFPTAGADVDNKVGLLRVQVDF